MIPRATYRLQFHAGFGFADALAILPYLDALGISHVYASPITTARRGSTHGYDVVDPTRINPELGGEAGFRTLVAALRARGMGIIIDIVPNHMGVAGGENPWWNDVLARGQASPYARFFDIDWSGPIVLPLLGMPPAEAIAAGEIAVVQEGGRWLILAHGTHRLPIRDEDQPHVAPGLDGAALRALIDRQPWRLAWWRAANDVLNWRRFFTINDLAGLRVEDEAVFEATHALIFRLYGEGLIDGVRVDHVDGLTDPAGYCRRLRARLDALPRPGGAPPGPAYIVVEKILGPGEPLAGDWGVDGTSGYDFMDQAAALLHAPEGAAALGALWAELSGRPAAFAPEELAARQDLLAWQFAGQLDGCVRAFSALAVSSAETEALTPAMLRRAIERLLWVFPVYRTYGTGAAAPAGDAAIRAEARARVERFLPPGEAPVLDRLLGWLAGAGPGDAALAAEAVRRFQQLSAPIAAKAVEDTAFYRHGPLLSRLDVGFDAARLGVDPPDFAAAMAARARDWPHAMLATATHDHKRGEDVRARLAVLSEIPARWRAEVLRWEALADPLAEGVDRGDRYLLFQTLLGAWPDEAVPETFATFADRIAAWQVKALREAKLRSSWEAPDEAYEARCADLTRAILLDEAGAPLRAAIAGFVAAIDPAARANSLVQAVLHCTLPGVPDLYQGAELFDRSLVDPDNRRPVDYALRRAVLAGEADPPGAEKLRLIRDLLALRRQAPALFAESGYAPLAVQGARARHVLAFARAAAGRRLRVIVALRCAEALIDPRPGGWEGWWADTRLAAEGAPIADLLAGRPYAVSLA